MSLPYETVEQDLALHRGAPKPWIFEWDAGGVPVSFPTSMVVRVTYGKNSFYDLTVGNGITLSDIDGVTNRRATVQPTRAQSRLLPPGLFARYEVQLYTGEGERPWMMGRVKAQGGDNPDG